MELHLNIHENENGTKQNYKRSFLISSGNQYIDFLKESIQQWIQGEYAVANDTCNNLCSKIMQMRKVNYKFP